jgi:type II secretory pathway pseudopilin PulG
MAMLLVGMSIAAIMMTAAMPVWKQMSQRDKEEELVFRGTQYVHALALFSRKFANASPPSLDVLVEQKFIRKKFKDPITNDDFQPILAGQPIPGASTAPQGAGAARGSSPTPAAVQASAQAGQAGQAQAGRGAQPNAGGPAGGIIGVVSKSKDKSIRIYNGKSHYNEWAFINVQQTQQPGAGGAPGTGQPGQRSGQPGQPGGPGGVNGRGGRGQNPNGRPGGPGPSPFGPQRGGPGGSPFQPGQSPFQPGQPVQPIQPGRGRGL